MPDKITLASKFALIHEHWKPHIAGELNGQLIKLVKFQDEFVWHHHDNEDEMFLVVKGKFRMEFRGFEGDRLQPSRNDHGFRAALAAEVNPSGPKGPDSSRLHSARLEAVPLQNESNAGEGAHSAPSLHSHRATQGPATRTVTIREGEFIIVPRGVEHKPVADEECWVRLFEPASTLNTGNVVNERTVHELKRV
jgi:mannose-6-phosphate isomerase-like protein (cupin superfamily)